MFKQIISACLLASLVFLFGCGKQKQNNDGTSESTDKKSDNTQASVSVDGCVLPESADAGEEYINSFVFMGESTTYHLKSRGVLSGGTATTQVWGPKSGTMMLDASAFATRIVYPESGEELDIGVAAKQKQPRRLLLCFGLNGAVGSIARGSAYFKKCYSSLIDTVLASSPSTQIVIQSCYPIAASMDMSGYSVDAKTLNGYIDNINSWARELCEERGIPYLNTCEILKDGNGFLFEEYQSGDGYHLTREAYLEILKYIRTHAIKEG